MAYRAMISSDWNQCLAPTGPFDPFFFIYPDLEPQMNEVFRDYTSNKIPLSEASNRIGRLLPEPFTAAQMDAYLDARFSMYRNVDKLISWCLDRNILFMINTTGMQGFFERIFAKGLLPTIPAVASNPMVRFPERGEESRYAYPVVETDDKGRHTEAVMSAYGLRPDRLVVMGDSGGDGPHFAWGAAHGAVLVSSMTKPSLDTYCTQRGIAIDHRFGLSYRDGEPRHVPDEMNVDFLELTDFLSKTLL